MCCCFTLIHTVLLSFSWFLPRFESTVQWAYHQCHQKALSLLHSKWLDMLSNSKIQVIFFPFLTRICLKRPWQALVSFPPIYIINGFSSSLKSDIFKIQFPDTSHRSILWNSRRKHLHKLQTSWDSYCLRNTGFGAEVGATVPQSYDPVLMDHRTTLNKLLHTAQYGLSSLFYD